MPDGPPPAYMPTPPGGEYPHYQPPYPPPHQQQDHEWQQDGDAPPPYQGYPDLSGFPGAAGQYQNNQSKYFVCMEESSVKS